MARGKAVAIVLSDRERVELERRVRRRKSSHGAARRARIVLLAADGLSNLAIAGSWASRRTVGLVPALPRGGSAGSTMSRGPAAAKIGDDKIAEVVTRALETMPDGATLEPPLDGPGDHLRDDGAPYLGRLRPAAAPGRELQAVERP